MRGEFDGAELLLVMLAASLGGLLEYVILKHYSK